MFNGLHQSCTVALVLFILHFGAVVDDWRSNCSTAGSEFRCKLSHKLVGERTAKCQLPFDAITEMQFAEAATLYATSGDSL